MALSLKKVEWASILFFLKANGLEVLKCIYDVKIS